MTWLPISRRCIDVGQKAGRDSESFRLTRKKQLFIHFLREGLNDGGRCYRIRLSAESLGLRHDAERPRGRGKGGRSGNVLQGGRDPGRHEPDVLIHASGNPGCLEKEANVVLDSE